MNNQFSFTLFWVNGIQSNKRRITMRKQMLRRAILLITGFVLVAVLHQYTPLQAKAADNFPKPTFNDKGELLRPDVSYRE
jgi:hypothetical protein